MRQFHIPFNFQHPWLVSSLLLNLQFNFPRGYELLFYYWVLLLFDIFIMLYLFVMAMAIYKWFLFELLHVNQLSAFLHARLVKNKSLYWFAFFGDFLNSISELFMSIHHLAFFVESPDFFITYYNQFINLYVNLILA